MSLHTAVLEPPGLSGPWHSPAWTPAETSGTISGLSLHSAGWGAGERCRDDADDDCHLLSEGTTWLLLSWNVDTSCGSPNTARRPRPLVPHKHMRSLCLLPAASGDSDKNKEVDHKAFETSIPRAQPPAASPSPPKENNGPNKSRVDRGFLGFMLKADHVIQGASPRSPKLTSGLSWAPRCWWGGASCMDQIAVREGSRRGGLLVTPCMAQTPLFPAPEAQGPLDVPTCSAGTSPTNPLPTLLQSLARPEGGVGAGSRNEERPLQPSRVGTPPRALMGGGLRWSPENWTPVQGCQEGRGELGAGGAGVRRGGGLQPLTLAAGKTVGTGSRFTLHAHGWVHVCALPDCGFVHMCLVCVCMDMYTLPGVWWCIFEHVCEHADAC